MDMSPGSGGVDACISPAHGPEHARLIVTKVFIRRLRQDQRHIQVNTQ